MLCRPPFLGAPIIGTYLFLQMHPSPADRCKPSLDDDAQLGENSLREFAAVRVITDLTQGINKPTMTPSQPTTSMSLGLAICPGRLLLTLRKSTRLAECRHDSIISFAGYSFFKDLNIVDRLPKDVLPFRAFVTVILERKSVRIRERIYFTGTANQQLSLGCRPVRAFQLKYVQI